MKTKILMALAVTLATTTSAFAASENVTIQGDHGALAAVVQRPDGLEQYPMVILSHGFTASKEDKIMTNVANKLEKEGVASIRFDFNGHGQSQGLSQDMTVPNEVSDLKHVYDYASQLPGVKKIGLLGHSQGGVVSSMTAGELGSKKIKALVLMAPAAVLREDAIRGNMMGIQYDPLNPPAVIELPMLHNFKVGANYVKEAQNLQIFPTAAKYKGQALMIHGKADVIAPWSYSERYGQTFKHGQVNYLPTADHVFSNPQDMDQATTWAADFLAQNLK